MNIDLQATKKQEKSDCINNDRYEPIASINAENIFSVSEDVIKEKNEALKDTPMQTSLICNGSESGTSVLNSGNKNNALILSTSDLATSAASELEAHESFALQASMEAILVASATPEIHSQYELATIEEQPELGYQSDSSDTDSLLLSSTARSKIINGHNGGAGQNVKRKSSNVCSTSIESPANSSSETANKILPPVMEDMMEDNDN